MSLTTQIPRNTRNRMIATLAAIALMFGIGLSAATDARAESAVGGPITRGEVWDRGISWVHQGVRYSNTARHPDPQGRLYRQDCSGMVSMAWHLPAEPSTNQFGPYVNQLSSFADMQTGDIFLKPKSSANAKNGHVSIFVSWTNSSKTTANIMEENGTRARATTHSVASYAASGYKPYRYKNIQDDAVQAPPTTEQPAPAPEVVAPVVVPKLAVIDSGRTSLMKSGPVTAGWDTVATEALDIQTTADRVAVLQTDNALSVREGNGAWVRVATDVKSFSITGDRIAIVSTGGDMYVKEGSLDEPWTLAAQGITQVASDGDRIGVLTSGGEFYAKDGEVNTEWVREGNAVAQIAVNGNRMAAVATDGTVRVKEGITGEWVTLATGAAKVALGGNRIAFISTGGELYVKDGAVTAEWVKEATSVTSVALTPERIGMVQTDGSINVKEGTLYSPWTAIGGGTLISLS